MSQGYKHMPNSQTESNQSFPSVMANVARLYHILFCQTRKEWIPCGSHPFLYKVLKKKRKFS